MLFHIDLLHRGCKARSRFKSGEVASDVRSYSAAVRFSTSYEDRRFELSAIYLPNGAMNTEKPTDLNGDLQLALETAWETLLGRSLEPWSGSVCSTK